MGGWSYCHYEVNFYCRRLKQECDPGVPGIKAETRLVILHVVTPQPTGEDHAGVMAGLQRGTWR